jgi:hypothetical protein
MTIDEGDAGTSVHVTGLYVGWVLGTHVDALDDVNEFDIFGDEDSLSLLLVSLARIQAAGAAGSSEIVFIPASWIGMEGELPLETMPASVRI